MAETKVITCFFIVNGIIKSHSKNIINKNEEAIAIQYIIEEYNYNPNNLLFVIDDLNLTYKAEYLSTLESFKTGNQTWKQ